MKWEWMLARGNWKNSVERVGAAAMTGVHVAGSVRYTCFCTCTQCARAQARLALTFPGHVPHGRVPYGRRRTSDCDGRGRDREEIAGYLGICRRRDLPEGRRGSKGETFGPKLSTAAPVLLVAARWRSDTIIRRIFAPFRTYAECTADQCRSLLKEDWEWIQSGVKRSWMQ